MSVPTPKRGNLSRDVLIDKLPHWLEVLWHNPTATLWFDDREAPLEWTLHIGGCREGGPRYVFKRVTDDDNERSEWHFITPPKFKKFENENLDN